MGASEAARAEYLGPPRAQAAPGQWQEQGMTRSMLGRTRQPGQGAPGKGATRARRGGHDKGWARPGPDNAGARGGQGQNNERAMQRQWWVPSKHGHTNLDKENAYKYESIHQHLSKYIKNYLDLAILRYSTRYEVHS